MSITIVFHSGKVLKGDIVKISYSEQRNTKSKPSKHEVESKITPHPDLKKAFEGLALHAAIIGEFIPSSSITDISNVDPELIKGYNASGFSLSGSDQDQVILTAQKLLKSGKSMNFNTPLTRLNDESENAYPFIDELVDAIELCKEELLKYMDGKCGDAVQQELTFEHQGSEDKEEPIVF